VLPLVLLLLPPSPLHLSPLLQPMQTQVPLSSNYCKLQVPFSSNSAPGAEKLIAQGFDISNLDRGTISDRAGASEAARLDQGKRDRDASTKLRVQQ
jgi:hypothetical protein